MRWRRRPEPPPSTPRKRYGEWSDIPVDLDAFRLLLHALAEYEMCVTLCQSGEWERAAQCRIDAISNVELATGYMNGRGIKL